MRATLGLLLMIALASTAGAVTLSAPAEVPPTVAPCECLDGVATGTGVYTEHAADPGFFNGECTSTAGVVTHVISGQLLFELGGTSGSPCDVDGFFGFDCTSSADGTLTCLDLEDVDGFVDGATLTASGAFSFRAGNGDGSFRQSFDGQLTRLV